MQWVNLKGRRIPNLLPAFVEFGLWESWVGKVHLGLKGQLAIHRMVIVSPTASFAHLASQFIVGKITSSPLQIPTKTYFQSLIFHFNPPHVRSGPKTGFDPPVADAQGLHREWLPTRSPADYVSVAHRPSGRTVGPYPRRVLKNVPSGFRPPDAMWLRYGQK